MLPEFLAESLFKPALQVLGGSVLLAVVSFQGYAFLHNVLAGHVNETINLVLSMGLWPEEPAWRSLRAHPG